MWCRWPAILWVCLVAACAPAKDPAAGDGGLEPGQACTTSEDCRRGLVCDPRRSVCVCTSDDACPQGWSCHPVSGGCVIRAPGCKGDEDCLSGEHCEGGVCERSRAYCEPCERDGHCAGSSSTCHPDGFCGAACTVDADCGPRSRCQRGQCAPALRCLELSGKPTGHCLGTCSSDEDCPMPGDRCEHRLCRPAIGCADLEPCTPDTFAPCTKDAECVEGVDQACEGGVCVARRSGCSHAEACDPLTLSCIAGCVSDLDCRPGTACAAGACRQVERCQTHVDCPKGRVCACPKGKTCSLPGDFGVCKPACVTAEDCPLRMVCVAEFDRRICKPGCGSDDDCGAAERCDPGSGICVGDERTCKIDEVCGVCELCVEGHCAKAASQSVPYCAPCWEDSTCGEGGVCWQRRCAPSCEVERCPSGFTCTRLGEDGQRGCLPLDGVCDTECL